jgi:hypothetical protein
MAMVSSAGPRRLLAVRSRFHYKSSLTLNCFTPPLGSGCGVVLLPSNKKAQTCTCLADYWPELGHSTRNITTGKYLLDEKHPFYTPCNPHIVVPSVFPLCFNLARSGQPARAMNWPERGPQIQSEP